MLDTSVSRISRRQSTVDFPEQKKSPFAWWSVLLFLFPLSGGKWRIRENSFSFFAIPHIARGKKRDLNFKLAKGTVREKERRRRRRRKMAFPPNGNAILRFGKWIFRLIRFWRAPSHHFHHQVKAKNTRPPLHTCAHILEDGQHIIPIVMCISPFEQVCVCANPRTLST